MRLMPLNVFSDIDLPLFFAGKVGWLMLMMLLLSGPIVVACLLTDVSLGLINRFASQLNVYVLAMPIKSGVAAFLILFYFMMLLSNAAGLFDGFKADLRELGRLLPGATRPNSLHPNACASPAKKGTSARARTSPPP